MAKVPRNKKAKRPTVLTKKTQRIKPQKKKTPMPLYQKMKANNHLLATALNQEKQESQMLFLKNTELMAEIQDLNLACRSRDALLHNILTNAKDMMQTIVTMSGFLSNTISSCNEILSNQNYVNTSRRTSSPCRRESGKRLSMKSPAKGVVKPMVSGHMITKPTINLSRVHMPRPPISNLSLIEERPSTSDGSPPENRLSRSEILPLALNRNQDEDVLSNNRRTSRFSTNRLSSGRRYSKRKSGRLSGRLSLSKRHSDYPEMKSPRVQLQDVSRILLNNQTISASLFAETSSRLSQSNHSSQDVSQNDANSDYTNENPVIIPETQQSQDSSSESDEENSSILPSSRTRISTKAEIHQSLTRKSNQPLMESHLIDPMEGSSWMFDSTQNDIDDNEDQENRPPPNDNSSEEERNGATSPISSFSCTNNGARRSSLFRVPDLPKAFGKRNPIRANLNASISSPTPLGTVLDTSTYPSANDNDDDEDDDDYDHNNDGNVDDDDDDDYQDRRIVHFVTERRGPSSRTSSRRYGSERPSTNNNGYQDDDDDDDDDDETLMINMRNQLKPRFVTHQSNLDERPERLQFDVNELLQLTPLKPLMKMNGRANAGPALMAQQDNDEPTATIQLTERPTRPAAEDTDTMTMSRMSTQRVPRQWQQEESSISTVRCQDQRTQNKRFSELTTERLSRSRIELPRMTEVLDYTANQTQIIKSPDVSKSKENPKRRKAVKKKVVSDDEAPDHSEKKTRQRKMKTKDKENKKKDSDENESNENDGSARRSSLRLQETVRNSSSSSMASRSSVLQPAEQSSDSECSVASNKPLSTRPRRKKAPTNLHEPSLIKKLRRG